MPCMDTSPHADQAYREQVLPPSCRARVAVEAAAPFGWHRWIGEAGGFVGMETFGESGPAKDVYEHFGITRRARGGDRAGARIRMSTLVESQLADENPLVEGLERLPVHPTALVIFGATGDLAHRKLLPALYNLAHEGALPERFELIGVARRDQPRRGLPRDGAGVDRAVLAPQTRPRRARWRCSRDMRYVPGSFDDDEVYAELDRTLDEFDERAGHALNRVFYLSTAPRVLPGHRRQARRRGPGRCEQAQTSGS